MPEDITTEVSITEKDNINKIPELKKTSRAKELIDIEAMSAFQNIKEPAPAQQTQQN